MKKWLTGTRAGGIALLAIAAAVSARKLLSATSQHQQQKPTDNLDDADLFEHVDIKNTTQTVPPSTSAAAAVQKKLAAQPITLKYIPPMPQPTVKAAGPAGGVTHQQQQQRKEKEALKEKAAVHDENTTGDEDCTYRIIIVKNQGPEGQQQSSHKSTVKDAQHTTSSAKSNNNNDHTKRKKGKGGSVVTSAKGCSAQLEPSTDERLRRIWIVMRALTGEDLPPEAISASAVT